MSPYGVNGPQWFKYVWDESDLLNIIMDIYIYIYIVYVRYSNSNVADDYQIRMT